MARVTVEDCVLKIPNRFELVLMASQRAKNISSGAPLTIERDRDKNPVIALREIADETISLADLENALITGMQKFAKVEETTAEEEVLVADVDMSSLDADFDYLNDNETVVESGAFEIAEETDIDQES